MADPDVTVETHIRASAARVWAGVADPRQIVRWSPESTGVHASIEGPLPAGATFTGSNRNGAVGWSTRCRVVESVPSSAFAFDVSFAGLAVSRWRYSITQEGDGLVVREEWWDRRGALMKALSTLGTGVVDRRTHNEAGMRITLASLKATMEMPEGP